MKKYAYWGLCLVSIVFIGAAIGKAQSVALLEKDIFSFFNMAYDTTNYSVRILARLLIGLEVGLGLALLMPYARKKVFIPATFLVTLGFTFYLFILLFRGVTEECGCFGSWIKMTTEMSIAKNVVIMGVLAWAYKIYEMKDDKNFNWVPAVSWILSLLVFIVILPMKQLPVISPNSGKVDIVTSGPFPGVQWENETLADDAIVAFFSVSCDHCKEVATAMTEQLDQLPPIYMAMSGDETLMEQFWAETGLDVPYVFVDDEVFFTFIGELPPRVYKIEKGKIAFYKDAEELNALEEFLKSK
ncbi:MAG: hypothetical protein MK193_11930 [Lentisphaeria bacterium]|nr:hypothetical protein [Lentisphaeria bacterium]